VPTPEQLEKQADDLRDLARRARATATSLATHLDAVHATAQDEQVWKGPYPAEVVGQLAAFVADLGAAADGLGADADAWSRRADALDQSAADKRTAQKTAQTTGGG
jgi:hypothetical protein